MFIETAVLQKREKGIRANTSQGDAWVRAGTGPWLTPEEKRVLLAEKGAPCFFSSGKGNWSCAVAQLPLAIASSSLVLLVTSPHPSRFLPREQDY